MYFLCRPDTKTYITIHKEDKSNFIELVNSDFLQKKINFI